MSPDGHRGCWAVSADRKLYHLGAGVPRRLAPPREDVFSELLCALPDREGGLRLGTSVAGLTRLRPPYFDHYPLGEGEEAACFTVAAEPDGTVWAASKSRLRRWRSGQADQWVLPFASPMNQIFGLLPDGAGGSSSPRIGRACSIGGTEGWKTTPKGPEWPAHGCGCWRAGGMARCGAGSGGDVLARQSGLTGPEPSAMANRRPAVSRP